MIDINLVKRDIDDLIGLSYDTGYYAGKAEAGEEINTEIQRQAILARYRMKMALMEHIQSLMEKVILRNRELEGEVERLRKAIEIASEKGKGIT